MNGNIVKVDNLRSKNGRRKEFMIVQNKILNKYRQKHKYYEFMLYNTLLGLAGTDFNLTVSSVRTLMGGQRAKAQRAIKTLEADGLIKARLEKDGKGDKTIITQDGRKVPNTRRVYEIYTALPEEQERTAVLLTPGTFITDTEFTADEILESESTPQAVSEIAEPPKVRQEMPQQAAYSPPPVLKPPQSREPVQCNNKTAMEKEQAIKQATERRKEEIYRIADDEKLFNQRGREQLFHWLERFKKELGRAAKNEEIKAMAILLSGNSSYDLSGYIQRKALSELPA